MTKYLLAEMTRNELETRLANKPIAILPLGATEQHGHHLPLGTDTQLAETYALRIAEKVGGIVLPSIPFGYSWVWQDVPGTITVGHRTLETLLVDVIDSVERSGFGMLVLVDGHDSNKTSMKFVVREHAAHSSFPVVRLFYPNLDDVRRSNCESSTWHGMIHACEFETSLMLASHPDLVDMTKAVREYPDPSPAYEYGAEQLGNISKSGVFGDATIATAEKGSAMLNRFVDDAVQIIQGARR